jgi:hypothetical protein
VLQGNAVSTGAEPILQQGWEDDYGEEGEEENEQEGQEKGRPGAQEEENAESVSEEAGEKGDKEGCAEAQGAGQESACGCGTGCGARSVLAASLGVGIGNRRNQLTRLSFCDLLCGNERRGLTVAAFAPLCRGGTLHRCAKANSMAIMHDAGAERRSVADNDRLFCFPGGASCRPTTSC